MTYYRQGDLTLHRTGDAPTGITTGKPIIVAYGERSGHWHELSGGVLDGDTITVPGPDDARLLVQPSTHADRHEPVTLPPGTYRLLGVPDDASKWLGQREYTPESIRTVGD